jgi:hypothetical protein
MPLCPTFLHAREFLGRNQPWSLMRNQPRALREKRQQQTPGQDLWRAEPLAREKRTHEAKGCFTMSRRNRGEGQWNQIT